jgi:dolichol-phosphate mannosyltransferase
MKKLISIVIPTFNEQDNIPKLYEKLKEILSNVQNRYTHEIIFIDDGSRDETWAIISNLTKHDQCVIGRKFSRNFGHQIALTAGYDIAQGDCIITMDADLQDPPELILKMIEAWEHGASIVYARRIHRADNFLKRVTAQWYYALMSHVSDVDIPRNVGDFRLIDKTVLKHIRTLKEKSRYLRGLVAWMGHKCAYIDFERPNRASGKSGYTWKKMYVLGFDGLTSFSLFPLRIVGYISTGAFLIVAFIFLYMLYQTLAYGLQHYALGTWLAMWGFMLMGVQSFALWLLGEYVGRIYKETLNRPLYIIEDERNCHYKNDEVSDVT